MGCFAGGSDAQGPRGESDNRAKRKREAGTQAAVQSQGGDAAPKDVPAAPGDALKLALRFAHGHGFVRASKVVVDGVHLDELVLRLEHLAFPFDLSGGAASFRGRQTKLWALALRLDESKLAALAAQVPWDQEDLRDVQLLVEGQALVLVGFAGAPASAAGEAGGEKTCTGFCLRLHARPVAEGRLQLLAYDARLWGQGEANCVDIVARVRRCLASALRAAVSAEAAAELSFSPAQALGRLLLPRAGWKVPQIGALVWQGCTLQAGGLQLQLRCPEHPAKAGQTPGAAAEHQAAGLAQLADRNKGRGQSPAALALLGFDACAASEAQLLAGQTEQALLGYVTALRQTPLAPSWGAGHASKDLPQLNLWAARRLLELQQMEPALFAGNDGQAENAQAALAQARAALADETFVELQAVAAQATPAQRARGYEATLQAGRKGRRLLPLERALSAWAAAESLGRADPAKAIAHLEAAFALGLASPEVFAPLFGLYRQQDDYAASRRVAERWLACLEFAAASGGAKNSAVAEVHVRLAQLLADANDTAGATEHLRAALQADAHNAPAQAAMAQLCARAGETERARTLLTAMQGQVQQLAPAQAAQHLVVVARGWQEVLADDERALAAYEAARRYAPAQSFVLLPLAALYERRGLLQKSATLLEQLACPAELGAGTQAAAWEDAWSVELNTPQATSLQNLHVRLADYAGAGHVGEGQSQTPLHRCAFHLEAALHLAPSQHALRRRLGEVYAQLENWQALAALLAKGAALAEAEGRLDVAREVYLEAARLHLRPGAPAAATHEARGALAAVLAQNPADDEALSLMLALLQSGGSEGDQEAGRLVAAAIAHAPSVLSRGRWQVVAAERLDPEQVSPETRLLAWRTALDSLPQHCQAARAYLDLLERSHGRNHGRNQTGNQADVTLAEAYLILAGAVITASERAQALLAAARAYSWAGETEAALAALERSVDQMSGQMSGQMTGQVDAWLLGAQLLEAPDREPMAVVRWLERALAACDSACDSASPAVSGTPVHRLHARLADAYAQVQDLAGESRALVAVAQNGGICSEVCERLLGCLARQDRPQQMAEWLLVWADAGWPLEVGPAYMRAAKLLEDCDEPAKLAQVLRRAMAAGGEAAGEAGAWLERLGVQNGVAQDRVDGVLGQIYACEERHGGVAVGTGELDGRLMWAQLDAGDLAGAESTCCRLLAVDPQGAAAHAFLAQLFVRRQLWDEALDHFFVALTGPRAGDLTAKAAQGVADEALALAQELRPEAAPRLREAAQELVGEALPMPAPLAERLARLESWPVLAALLEHKLSRCEQAGADEASKVALRRSLASVLHAHLGESEGAVQLLRQNLAADIRDVASREALLPIYAALDRPQELAELHFALSQLVHGVHEALAHVLASARLYAQQPDGQQLAGDMLLAFARRSDVPPSFPALWQGLRELSLHRELERLLAASLEQQPGGDDGRLAELVEVVCGPRGAPERAIDWCVRLQRAVPGDDAPWQLHVATLRRRLGGDADARAAFLTAAEQIYVRWAEARTGEAQAQVLEAHANLLRDAGETGRSLTLLEAAVAVADAQPLARRDRQAALGERCLATGQVGRGVEVLSVHAAQLPAGEARDALLRRLATLCAEQLAAPERALRALLELGAPTPADHVAMGRAALEAGQVEALVAVPAVLATLSPTALSQALHLCFEAGDLRCCRALAEALMAVFFTDAAAHDEAIEALLRRLATAWELAGASRAWVGWTLALAERAPQVWAVRLRLDALLRLHALGREGGEHAPLGQLGANPGSAADQDADDAQVAAALVPGFAETALQAACLQRPQDARRALRLATLLHHGTARLAAARALLEQAQAACEPGEAVNDRAPGHDGLWGEVLLACGEAELEAQGPLLPEAAERALHFAERLTALGDARGRGLRVKALLAAGREGELVALLREQAAAAPAAQAPAAWLQLAEVLCRTEDFAGSATALQAVPALARSRNWGQLAFTVYAAQKAFKQQAEAAELVAQCAATTGERASWLRREAQVRWWRLGEQAAAASLLQAAAKLLPLRPEAVLQASRSLPPAEGRQALEEALVVATGSQQAPLWRRLADLAPSAVEEVRALAQALRCVGDDAAELQSLVAAARTAGHAGLLAQALVLQAERKHAGKDFHGAAELWMEAARLAPEHDAGALWLQAAQARVRAGEPAEARALCQQALALGERSTELWQLVWRLFDGSEPLRREAAYALLQAAGPGAPKAEPQAQAATEALLAEQLDQAVQGARFALEQQQAELAHSWLEAAEAQVMQLLAADAPLAEPARQQVAAWLRISNLTLEAQGDAQALLQLWRHPAVAQALPADVVHAWLRRAVYLGARELPADQVRQGWLDLLAHGAANTEAEAVLQLWASWARAVGKADPAHADCADALVQHVAATLEAAPMQMQRAEWALLAADLWERLAGRAAESVRVLGHEFDAWMARWQRPDLRGQLQWAALERLTAALLQRLTDSDRLTDAVAVAARLALVAPSNRRLPRLYEAGQLAQALGDDAQAYALWLPVAQSGSGDRARDPGGQSPALAADALQAAAAFCVDYARQQNDAAAVVALLTRGARSAEPRRAASLLAEAASWAQRGLGDAEQARRLLQAAHALDAAGGHAAPLATALLGAADVASLHQALDLLLGAQLAPHALEALAEALHAACTASGESALTDRLPNLWQHVLQEVPTALCGLRHLVQQVREQAAATPVRAGQTAADGPVQAQHLAQQTALLAALQRLLAAQAEDDPARAGTAAEAAALAWDQGQHAWALLAWEVALGCAAPQPSWALAALTALAAAPRELADAGGEAQALLGRLAATAQTLRLRAKDAAEPDHERCCAWQAVALLAERAGALGDAVQAQRAACSLLQPGDAAALAAQEKLAALLAANQDWEALATLLASLAADEQADGRRRADHAVARGRVLADHLGEPVRATASFAQAHALCPDHPEARLALAEQLLVAGEANRALDLVAAQPLGKAQRGQNGPAEALQAWTHARQHLALAACILQGRAAASPSLSAGLAEVLQAEANEVPLVAVALAQVRLQQRDFGQVKGLAQAALRSLAFAHEAERTCELAQAPPAQPRAAAFGVALQAKLHGPLLHAARQLGAEACLALGEPHAARELLRAAVEAALDPSSRAPLQEALWQACLADEAWEEAAELACAQAAQAQQPAGRQAALLEAASLVQKRLGDLPRACALTLEAAECLPENNAVWWRLHALLAASTELAGATAALQAQRRQVAEHLLAHAETEHLDAAFLSELAQMVAEEDPARSHALFARAAHAGELAAPLQVAWSEVAWQAGKLETYAELAGAADRAAPGDEDLTERLHRRVRLATACMRSPNLRTQGRTWLERALEGVEEVLGGRMQGEQLDAWRQVADLCTTEADLRYRAQALYNEILQHTPTNVDVLRIAARLAGAQADTDRAYGLYACLLWLVPADDEAGRFVRACRAQAAKQAEDMRLRGQARPLVKKVQAALEEVTATNALPSAARPSRAYDVAQLVRRDIDAVLREMVPSPHGVPRATTLRTLPDAMTLFRFAQSPAYFALRQHLER